MDTDDAQARRIPQLKPGIYSDGSPLDEVHYLESKLILKPDRFTSVANFHEFGDLVSATARKLGVGFSSEAAKATRPRIREVVFLDTADFRLYNNAFILRRRISYEDGFAVGDPEIVFKFRHPDLQRAAETDVRPNLPVKYRIKFKAEALPLRDRIGGYRLLYSHNVEFRLSGAEQRDRIPMARLARVFPVLEGLKRSDDEPLMLVNETIVEEVLQELGVLDFGKAVTAGASASLWRQRGDHRPLAGEFSFECKFKRRDELHEKAIERGRRFFIALQETVCDWLSLGTTKTGIVYHLKGNPPQSHE